MFLSAGRVGCILLYAARRFSVAGHRKMDAIFCIVHTVESLLSSSSDTYIQPVGIPFRVDENHNT